MTRKSRTVEPRSFETLRDSVAIAARHLTKEQIHELADHLFAALRRKTDAVTWERARDGGTAGFT